MHPDSRITIELRIVGSAVESLTTLGTWNALLVGGYFVHVVLVAVITEIIVAKELSCLLDSSPISRLSVTGVECKLFFR